MLAGVVLGVGGVSPGASSSSVELNGLDGIHDVFHGVAGSGSNEACSMLEIWWILGVFLNGVGKLMVS